MSVQYTGGKVQYTGGISLRTPGGYHWVHRRGVSSTLGCPYKFSCFPNDLPPHFIMPSASELMISPTILMIPPVYWTSPLYCTPPVYCTDIMQGDHTICKPGLVTMTLQALFCNLPWNVSLELSNSQGRRQAYILDKNSLRALTGVETVSLTFGTKQYSTSYSSYLLRQTIL